MNGIRAATRTARPCCLKKPASARAESALGVAGPGADDAILAAVLVAVAQRGVLGLAQPGGDRVTVGAAGIAGVDGDRAAGAPHRNDLAAARAFAERGLRGGVVLGVVVAEAVGAAGADGERAGRLAPGGRADQQACRGDHARHSPAKAGHEKAPPPRNRTMLRARRFHLVNPGVGRHHGSRPGAAFAVIWPNTSAMVPALP